MNEDERKEILYLLSKIKDNMPDENDLPDILGFLPELETEIERAAKELCDKLYPKEGEEE